MSKIIFQQSNAELEWDDAEANILESAEAHGIDLNYGCRMGNCTACQQRLVSGEVGYPNGHSSEPDEGNVLLCCAVPKGEDDLVIDA